MFQIEVDFEEAARDMAEREEDGFTDSIAQHIIKLREEKPDPEFSEILIRVQYETTRALLEAGCEEGLGAVIANAMLENLVRIMINATERAQKVLRLPHNAAPAIPRPSGGASEPGTRRGP